MSAVNEILDFRSAQIEVLIEQLLDDKQNECPYRQTNDGCVRNYSKDEIEKHCQRRDDRADKAAQCWRTWSAGNATKRMEEVGP